MAGRKGRNISYTAQEEPAFIRRFKEKVGYKEDPSIEDKHAAPDLDNSDQESSSDSEEYKPQVVVLRKGDLTGEEAEKYADAQREKEKEEEDSASGRIMFKKPTKRASDETSDAGIVSSSSKRLKKGVASSFQNSNTSGSVTGKLDNVKLLSFDAECEDDD